jgi:hypothetical protein
VGLDNLRRQCIGPSISWQGLKERCPHGITIDMDIARLIRKSRHSDKTVRLHLDCRCVIYHSEVQAREWFASSGLECRAHSFVCAWIGCSEPRIQGAFGCNQDLWLLNRASSRVTFDRQAAQDMFRSAARKRWIAPTNCSIVR